VTTDTQMRLETGTHLKEMANCDESVSWGLVSRRRTRKAPS